MLYDNYKVLILYPNPRKMSLVPSSIAIFAELLVNLGVNVDLFDASLFKQNEFEDADEYLEKFLAVKPFMNKLTDKVSYDETDVFDAFNYKIDDFQPDLIAVTCVESTFEYAISLLKSINSKKILTILGGVFATFSPEYALSYNEIDLVCVGEGENSIVKLVQSLIKDNDICMVPNIYYKKDGKIIKNPISPLLSLNDIPVGDYNIFHEKRFYRAMAGKIYKMFPVETHRGCLNKCTFCNSPLQNRFYQNKTKQIYYRTKSIEKVHKQIKYFVDNFKAEYFFFWADNFFSYSTKQIESFCDMYSDFRIPFFCQSYPSNISENKLQMLVDVGLKRIGVGIEHGNEEFRRKLIKRNYSNKTVIEKMDIVKKYDLEFSTNNIIGFPGETPELVMDTIELNRTIQPHSASCSIFAPFRGTALRELCLNKGFIENDNILAPSNDVKSILNMPNFPKDAIEGKRRTFAFYLKFPRKMWNEISLAEKLTPEGDKIWLRLQKKYCEQFK